MRLAPVLVLCLVASPAFAQATRTWVSGVGDDANPCSRTAPCKTFAGAITKTAAGGEINALDPGGYGSVTITKAITIDVHNVLGGVLAGGTNGVVVSAGASDVVVLRGLDFKGTASAPMGVRFVSGKALHVEDCTFDGFVTHGVSFEPSTSASTLLVRNSTITNTASTSATSGAVNVAGGTATLDRVVMTSGVNGLVASGTAKVTLHGGTASGNSAAGVRVSGTASVAIERSVISGNLTGVQVDPGAEARLSETMLSHNGTGLSGNVLSFGNNRVGAGNGSNGAPASTLSQQ